MKGILRGQQVLESLKMGAFSEHPLVRGAFLQTASGRYWPFRKVDVEKRYHQVTLEGQDRLSVVESCVDDLQAPLLVMVHGLSGCYSSSYMERMAGKFTQKGFHVFRINLRNCGPSIGWSKSGYHCGVSDDVKAVVDWIVSKFPSRELNLIGFSLGGNVALKYLVENSREMKGKIRRAMSVCPPADITRCAAKVRGQAFYDHFFVKELMHDVKRIRKINTHWPEVPDGLGLCQIDEVLTAPLAGFKSAEDYYEKCSTHRYLDKIEIPTLILASMDDPVIDGRCFLEAQETPNLKFVVTENGGHLGFLNAAIRQLRWMDDLALNWFVLEN